MASRMMKSETYPVSIQSSAENNASKQVLKGEKSAVGSSRPCNEHSFLTDVADVRTMEQGLLQLLEDFHSGKLQAFGGSMTFEKMDHIREQQERLARLHFEMELLQDMHRRDTEEGKSASNDKMSKLIDQLHAISSSIQRIQKE
ncbi:coiled-coil domain-containing protein 28A-like [Pecten maximus]|uniref:coiled-coil domain-containing protein 28A-like n=1 Tax=Pecten maximus TaxID=6579 RepID=UPI0014591AF2|nr:coiled-coil domain-containing protein 28A-like [Pecten maximus]